jgi:hypothetical protein
MHTKYLSVDSLKSTWKIPLVTPATLRTDIKHMLCDMNLLLILALCHDHIFSTLYTHFLKLPGITNFNIQN